MARASTILRFLLGYLTYFLSKVTFVLCAIPCLLPLLPFPKARRHFLHLVLRAYVTFLTRLWLPALGGYRIAEISGLNHVATHQPAIFVANHRSRLDALLLLGLIPPAGVILKAYHLRHLTYAILIHFFDFVSIDPTHLRSLGRALDRCRQLLNSGISLLVFPEGTRAPSGRLQPFKNTAFQLALETHLPIIPVVVHSTLPFMAKRPGSLFPRGSNTFRIRFLSADFPQPKDTPTSLSDRVRRRIAGELKSLDPGTPWEIQLPLPTNSTASPQTPNPEPRTPNPGP